MISLSQNLVLASNSPRRKQLLAEAGFDFTVEVIPIDESFPPQLPAEQVAGYISEKKAQEFAGSSAGKLILTADTVVIANGEILGKPVDARDAFRMLKMLSDSTHKVITAISLLTENGIQTRSDAAKVSFRHLEEWELTYYIEHYKPFDKAGAYGIQEWIGMVGIDRIEGSYYTIMGLPVHLVYQLLKPYFKA